jgi:hypothetical protein
MITQFDEYMIHQTAEPVTQPDPSDRNFYDRYWFNGYSRNGDCTFEVGFGLYPNRLVMDAHLTVVLDGRQHAFHASRRAPHERAEMNVGPLSIEIVEALRQVRVRLDDNETGISADLTFVARTAPHQEPRNVMYDDGRLIMNTTRYTQMGNWKGHVSASGTRVDVDPARWPGTRDRSWGVRPVGEPEAGAPGKLTTEPGVYWVWCPLMFDDFSSQFGTFEDRDGTPTQLSAHLLPVYDSPDDIPSGDDPGTELIQTVSHRIHWKPGTRCPERAEFDLLRPGGESLHIELEPMIRLHLLGIGYQHPEWGHATWKGEEAIAGESWSLDDMDLLDYKHIHVHNICRARVGNLEGIGTLETICFGRHDPSGFKELLDGA